MNFAVQKVQNANEDGSVPTGVWCEVCGNEGVVMLLGSTTVGGVEYSRGATTCKWCEQGALRYTEATAPSGLRKTTIPGRKEKHQHYHQQWWPVSDYTLFDVDQTAPEPRRGERFKPTTEFLLEREAAGCHRGALQQMFPRAIWPEGWTDTDGRGLVSGLDDASVASKRRLASEALNEAERTES